GITAASGIDRDCVLIAEVTGVEPRRKHRVPSCVVRAGGKLRDVVDRAIDLDAAKLAKKTAWLQFAALPPRRSGTSTPGGRAAGQARMRGPRWNQVKSARPQQKNFPRDSNRLRTLNWRELLAHPSAHLKCLRRELAGISSAVCRERFVQLHMG